MTYGHIKPELELRVPGTPAPKRKAPEPIPAMSQNKAPPSRFTDEQVIAAILEHLEGATYVAVATRLDTNPETVRHWCEGTMRRRCFFEADRRWRQRLKRKA